MSQRAILCGRGLGGVVFLNAWFTRARAGEKGTCDDDPPGVGPILSRERKVGLPPWRALTGRVAVLAALTVLAVLVPVTVSEAAPAPTPATTSTPATTASPSPGAGSGWNGTTVIAQQAKQSADAAVNAQVAKLQAAQKNLDVLTAKAEAAEQTYSLQAQLLATAQQQATDAKAEQVTARAKYIAARAVLRTIVVQSYMGSDQASTVSVLLTATDPQSLIDGVALNSYLHAAKAKLVAQCNATLVAKSLADDATRAAEQRQQAAASAALDARQVALVAQAVAQQQNASIDTALSKARLTQAQDDAVLAALGPRSGQSVSAAELGQYDQQAARAAKLPMAANPGHWTAEMGQSVVNRALQWLGTPYAFAGGNAKGPTSGVCTGGGAENDCHIVGFDCSGLSLYSWAPYLGMAHYAATQYSQAGSVHPTPAQVLPGDLIFWSSDGTIPGIHHVAIYVGNGNVIQAPQSGDYVRITPIGTVGSGIFGATRPMS